MTLTVLFMLGMAGAACLVLTPMIRNFSKARGWLDEPDGVRKLHPVAVPRIGGVPVFLSFAFATSLLLALDPVPGLARDPLVHLLVASAAVMLVGLVDDLVGVRPVVKLAVQSAAALYLYQHGFRIDALSNPFGADTLHLDAISLPLTLLWFVGMSNAFNLIDGLDGLAAGIGLFSTSTLFIAAVVNDRWAVACVASALGGALLGFLRYNFNPASIFLGDSGSLFVGFALAGIAVRGSIKSSAAIAVAAPLLALAVPILDASVSVLRRVVKGQSPFEADEDHIHHRMLRRGLTPQRVVITLYAVAALFGALSLFTMPERGQVIGLVVVASCVASWIGIQQLGYSEFAEVQRILRQGLFNERRTIDNNLFLRDWPTALAAAHDADALWSRLIEGLQRLGFVEVRLESPPERATWPLASRRWRAAEGEGAGEALTTWDVPLVAGEGPVVRLLLVRPLLSPTRFDARFLHDALTSAFATRLRDVGGTPTIRSEAVRLDRVVV